jgi:hypothetical protein
MRQRLAVPALLVLLFAARASAQVTYSSIPAPGHIPGNVPSVGFEATSSSELGDEIRFTPGTGRAPIKVDVLMSSWGCEGGHWFSGDCSTAPGATFDVPITLYLYSVNTAGPVHATGVQLAAVTQTFKIPYRPSASPSCADGTWLNPSDKQCYNGYATAIQFDLQQLKLQLPDSVIWSVSYNTSHYGPSPIGESASCYTSAGGCGYDSLNVGVQTFTPDILTGTDVDPDGIFWNTSYAPNYCDGGADGTGTFRADTGAGCWTDYRPLVRFNNSQRGAGR